MKYCNVQKAYFLIIYSILQITCLKAQHTQIEVNGSMPGMAIQNMDNASAGWMDLKNNANNIFQLGITGTNNNFWGSTKTAYIFTEKNADVPIVVAPNNNEAFRVTTDRSIIMGRDKMGQPHHNHAQSNSFIDIINLYDPKPSIFIAQDTGSAAISIAASGESKAIIANSEDFTAVDINNTSITQAALIVRSNNENNSADALATNNYGKGNALSAINWSTGPAASFYANSSQAAVFIQNDSTGNALYVGGDAVRSDGLTTWGVSSDIRLKKNIKPFKDGLEKIIQIEPKSFEYNGLCGTKEGVQRIGIIAQEIETVLPYTIARRSQKISPKNTESSEELEDVRTFNSSSLTFVMINAIKELNEKIENKEQIIQEQRQLIEMLSKRLDNIEKQISGTTSALSDKKQESSFSQ